MKKRALFSVTNKSGLEKFSKLKPMTHGWEIISTGKTAKYLEENEITVIPVEKVTNFPEMMDGRLKTLHPNIFGGILADRSKEEHLKAIAEHGIELIDLVVVNLYDFAGKPGIENIDIGGPSLIRAAAKNCSSAIILVDPNDYEDVIREINESEEGTISTAKRELLACKAFEYTAIYDRLIADWMRKKINEKRELSAFAI